MTTADVAVIIPAFRSAEVLDTTLASVAAQTVQPAVVVVVDDASGDTTASVARAWDGRLPLTVLALDGNLGPAGARRTGIASTSTHRLALLDADDVWLPDHLEVMLGCHDISGGLVTADPLRWIPGAGLATEGLEASLPVPPPAEQRAAILRYDYVFVGTVFERALYDEAGGFRDQFHGTEDWDLWIRMVRAGAVVHRAPHPTVLYRLSTGSISADERLVGEERRVLDAALTESTSDEDHAVITKAMREIDAKSAMYAAYGAARRRPLVEGAASGARWLARAWSRPSRCAALVVAPRFAVKARDERVNQPRWWLRP